MSSEDIMCTLEGKIDGAKREKRKIRSHHSAGLHFHSIIYCETVKMLCQGFHSWFCIVTTNSISIKLKKKNPWQNFSASCCSQGGLSLLQPAVYNSVIIHECCRGSKGGGGRELSMRECNSGEYLTQLQTGIQAPVAPGIGRVLRS